METTKTFKGLVNYFDDKRDIGEILSETHERIYFSSKTISNRSLKTVCKDETVRVDATLNFNNQIWNANKVSVLLTDGQVEVRDPTTDIQRLKIVFIGDGFFFLESEKIKHVYLHNSKILSNIQKVLKIEDDLDCIIVPTQKGYSAVVPKEAIDQNTSGNFQKSSDYYLSQAILNRDTKHYDKARQFFEDGLRVSPSTQLFSTYSAMERNLNDFNKAVEILKRAVSRYPKNGKFYEDLGNSLIKRNRSNEAIEIFRQGLENSPAHNILHLYLARALMTTNEDYKLKSALEEFKIAATTLHLTDKDKLFYGQLAVKFGHFRGSNALNFFKRTNFVLEAIAYHSLNTYAVDFLVRATNPEHIQTYDLRNKLFARCFFQNSVNPEDVSDLLEKRSSLLNGPDVNPDVIFIIVQNTDNIRNYLYRLNDQLTYPTVVPLPDISLQQGDQGIRDALDHWLFRRDLYDYHYPVSGRKFFGREAEIRQIGDSIQDNEWVGVFGLRKIGKTSVIEEIAKRRSKDITAVCDLLKFASISSCDQLLLDISIQFDTELTRRFDYPYRNIKDKLLLLPKAKEIFTLSKIDDITLKFDNDIKAIKETFAFNHLRIPKFLIILDEVERLLPINNQPGIPGYDTFISYFRGLAQQRQSVSMMLVGANPTVSETPNWSNIDNPLFEFLKIIYLPPFSLEECSDMVIKLGRGMGIEYDEKALFSLFNYTGGHPYITRQYCSFVAKRQLARPLRVSEELINEYCESFIFERSPVFQEILERLDRDFPIEKEMLMKIANGVTEEKILLTMARGSAQNALRHLAGYQLVERRKDETYSIRIGLLKLWLLKNWSGI